MSEINYDKCLRFINRQIDRMPGNATTKRLRKKLAFNKTVDSLAVEITNQYREIRGMVEADIESREVRMHFCPIQGLYYTPLLQGGREVGRLWHLAT